MLIQSLIGDWQFRPADSSEWLPAKVPGGVHTDLMAIGRIPDPFVADNEKRVQWVAESDWVYRTSFSCTDELLTEEKVFLVCDGLDTLATVVLNGHELGHTDNMFRQYQWEIKPLLNLNGTNDLTITFASPVKYAAERQALRPLPGVTQAIPGGPHLRKAPCQFGWDWGPQLPPIGIWKDVRLEGYSGARLAEVHLRQDHTGGQVTVKARIATQNWGKAQLAAVVRITAPDGNVIEKEAAITGQDEIKVNMPIPKPQLWWPNGYGKQSLYQVEVSLMRSEESKGRLLDQLTYQVGLRTIELRQQEDQWGRSFVFVANGVPIFVKGSNWIPADFSPLGSRANNWKASSARRLRRIRICYVSGVVDSMRMRAFMIFVIVMESLSGKSLSFPAASTRWTPPTSWKMFVWRSLRTSAACAIALVWHCGVETTRWNGAGWSGAGIVLSCRI